MINRDPVAGLTQRTSTIVKAPSPVPEKSPIRQEAPVVEEDSEQERFDLELAIQKSLEDQTAVLVESSSSSDSDGSSNDRRTFHCLSLSLVNRI